MHYIPFNPLSSFHKQPFGAVKDGTTVLFKIILPRHLSCTGVRLVVQSEPGGESRYPLEWERMEGYDEEWWRISFTPDVPGLFWYWFEYDCSWGTVLVKKGEDGFGKLSAFEGEPWQLTVYDRNFTTPDWIKGGVIYQIFPDRFNRSKGKIMKAREGEVIREEFSGEPMWEPDALGKITRYDFFGGDLLGIDEKLGYLQQLGVTCIYLNPIFEARSNHRYDTADYSTIDPMLGSVEDFEKLCVDAEKHGIRIILDGVFSHTGAESIYFNKFGTYPHKGAYESRHSKYYKWYKFKHWPDEYDCWWGVDILPEVNESEESYLDFISGENGIARRWLRAGASGWRLDVADELPDVFLDRFRECVKQEDPDAFILGEVWEDASNKISYGERRRYLLGRQLDSVMNYPFAHAVTDFIKTADAQRFMDRVVNILDHYPKPVIDTLMNHIGTHDTVRVLNVLSGVPVDEKTRRAAPLDSERRSYAKKLLMAAASIQFTLPGVPCIYYGDEAGLEGGFDPFNRACFPWGKEDAELLERYEKLGSLRRMIPALKDGTFNCVSSALGCIAFERLGENSAVLTISNMNPHEIDYILPERWHREYGVLGGERRQDFNVHIDAKSTAVLYFIRKE